MREFVFFRWTNLLVGLTAFCLSDAFDGDDAITSAGADIPRHRVHPLSCR